MKKASGLIAAVIIVKNEAHAIFEWLAHHASIGVDQFIIYDNGSTDTTVDQIRSFPDQKRIRLINWPMEFGQMPAYQNALMRFGRRFKWMAFIDADEFFIPLQHETLPEILADFENDDGLIVPWTLFGSSGHVTRPGGLILESYTHRAADDFDVNRHTKCIIKPSGIAGPTITPHNFIPLHPRGLVREDHVAIDHDTSQLPETFVPQRLRLHHYVVQSREDFANKQARGLATRSDPRDNSFFDIHDQNVVEDVTALRFVAAIREWQMRRLPARRRFGWLRRRPRGV
ncbi:hypothetical protein sos41_15240 [Alphaproteobacteria bacterium SO-S41]|nr:hypothetical protein sos41_15240 [Alphaproteobacteria bacterium SO-S41]